MSKKQIRKVHIGGVEYVYCLKEGFGGMYVTVYESGNKSRPLLDLSFDEYVQVTPSKIKEGIINSIEFKQHKRNKTIKKILDPTSDTSVS